MLVKCPRFLKSIELDMFATRINTQLPRFAACHPDTDAEIINAFSCD